MTEPWHKGFADRWWAHVHEHDRFETELASLIGGDWHHTRTDDYDASLEIDRVEPSVRLSPDAQRFIHEAGFAKVYVNHADGWETHYSWDWRKPFEPHRGWRRRRTDKGFEISYWPEGWTKTEWLENGYMTIVPDPLDPLSAAQ